MGEVGSRRSMHTSLERNSERLEKSPQTSSINWSGVRQVRLSHPHSEYVYVELPMHVEDLSTSLVDREIRDILLSSERCRSRQSTCDSEMRTLGFLEALEV